jgi:hypothetical protein
MKNILAENMLRFGVKNLKASEKKQIQKAMLSEDVVINGVTYKYPFKDANQINTSYLGNAAPWTQNAAASAGKFNQMESADLSSLMTLRAVYPDMLMEFAKRGVTPEQLKRMGGRVQYIMGIFNTVIKSDKAMAMVKQKGGWASPQAAMQNMSNNPKVQAWAQNWFIPTFEKAFATAFPQGIPAVNPQAPGTPQQ